MRNTFLIIASLFFYNFSYSQTNDEIIKSLTEVLESAVTKLKATDAEISPPTGQNKDWYRRKVYIANTDMDVQKTNSLVSPYVGESNFSCVVKGANALTLEDLNKKEDGFILPSKCRANFAFKNSKWKLTKFQCEQIDFDKKIKTYVDINEDSSNWTQKQCYLAF